MRRFILSAVACFAAPAFALAAEPKPATDAEKKAIELVEKAGGKAKVDDELGDTARVAVSFEKPGDDAVVKLAKNEHVGAVELRSVAKLTERGFGALKYIPNLRKLVIAAGTIEMTEAKAIGETASLTTLAVGGTKLGDGEISYFKKLKDLKHLDLMDTALTDAGLKTVLELTKLEELNLSGTKVTNDGAKKLLALEKLKLVQLNHSKVTREGIDAMEEVLKKDKRELIVRW